MSRNLMESLRHCYNSLRRDGHAFEFVVARERSEVRQALRRFLELQARRANMSSGASRHPNRFAASALQAFLYDVCDVLAARDVVRVFQLRIGGQIVASRLAFVVGDGVYLYYSGFDPAWARYSIMTTTVAEGIKYAIAAGLKTVLSLTAEQSKLRWRPRRVMLHSGLRLHHESMSWRLAYEVYRMAQSGKGAPARLLKSALRARRDWT